MLVRLQVYIASDPVSARAYFHVCNAGTVQRPPSSERHYSFLPGVD